MAIGPIIMGIGAVANGVGTMLGMSAQANADEYNADLARLNAEAAGRKYEFDIFALRREQAKQIGQMRADFGASGVRLEGSPLDVLKDSATAAAMDRNALKYSTDLAVAGFRSEASRLDSSAGRNRLLAPVAGAFDMLSGIGGLL